MSAVARKLAVAVSDRRGAAASGGARILVGLVGRGIGLSRSPAMHEREGARIGLGYAYVLLDFDRLELDDSHLGEVIAAAEDDGFAGLNVTHPFKQAVIPHLDSLSPEAASIGAVNTVLLRGGRRTGHNTDSWGFAESFGEELGDVPLGTVVQLGAGGAGAAVAYALMSRQVRDLILCDIDATRADDLAGRLTERFGRQVRVVLEVSGEVPAADGIVNTTPVGMAKYPGLPLSRELLRPRHWVADVIYFPAETELLRVARAIGCRTLSGTGMAVYQAVKAFELFTGIVPDRARMVDHFEAVA